MQSTNIIPQDARAILSTKALAHVATIGSNGEPQSTPVWFDFDGQYLRFSQTKTRQKYRNIQRDPHIALSIVDPANPYHYLEIRGEVARIEEDPKKDFINHLSKKYLDKDVYPWNVPGEERVVVYVKPEHATTM